MEKQECIEKSTIERSENADCFLVKIASKDKWISSPTNTLTPYKAYAACISDKEEAERLRKIHCDPEKDYIINE